MSIRSRKEITPGLCSGLTNVRYGNSHALWISLEGMSGGLHSKEEKACKSCEMLAWLEGLCSSLHTFFHVSLPPSARIHVPTILLVGWPWSWISTPSQDDGWTQTASFR